MKLYHMTYTFDKQQQGLKHDKAHISSEHDFQ